MRFSIIIQFTKLSQKCFFKDEVFKINDNYLKKEKINELELIVNSNYLFLLKNMNLAAIHYITTLSNPVCLNPNSYCLCYCML